MLAVLVVGRHDELHGFGNSILIDFQGRLNRLADTVLFISRLLFVLLRLLHGRLGNLAHWLICESGHFFGKDRHLGNILSHPLPAILINFEHFASPKNGIFLRASFHRKDGNFIQPFRISLAFPFTPLQTVFPGGRSWPRPHHFLQPHIIQALPPRPLPLFPYLFLDIIALISASKSSPEAHRTPPWLKLIFLKLHVRLQCLLTGFRWSRRWRPVLNWDVRGGLSAGFRDLQIIRSFSSLLNPLVNIRGSWVRWRGHRWVLNCQYRRGCQSLGSNSRVIKDWLHRWFLCPRTTSYWQIGLISRILWPVCIDDGCLVHRRNFQRLNIAIIKPVYSILFLFICRHIHFQFHNGHFRVLRITSEVDERVHVACPFIFTLWLPLILFNPNQRLSVLRLAPLSQSNLIRRSAAKDSTQIKVQVLIDHERRRRRLIYQTWRFSLLHAVYQLRLRFRKDIPPLLGRSRRHLIGLPMIRRHNINLLGGNDLGERVVVLDRSHQGRRLLGLFLFHQLGRLGLTVVYWLERAIIRIDPVLQHLLFF